jgi:LPS O-antigen subunit length determinant protein (WzzB/FepE family)
MEVIRLLPVITLTRITNILLNQGSVVIIFAVNLDVFQSCLSDLRRKSINNAARKKRQIENKAVESTRKKRLNQLEQSEEDRLKATQSNFCRHLSHNSVRQELFNESRVQRQLQKRQTASCDGNFYSRRI